MIEKQIPPYHLEAKWFREAFSKENTFLTDRNKFSQRLVPALFT